MNRRMETKLSLNNKQKKNNHDEGHKKKMNPQLPQQASHETIIKGKENPS